MWGRFHYELQALMCGGWEFVADFTNLTPRFRGGASALALAGGGLTLLIIAPPASSLSRPRTPPQVRGVRMWGKFHYELQAAV